MRRDLPAQTRIAGDGGDGGEVYFGVTESKSEGQGVVNVRADVCVEDDSMGQDPCACRRALQMGRYPPFSASAASMALWNTV